MEFSPTHNRRKVGARAHSCLAQPSGLDFERLVVSLVRPAPRAVHTKGEEPIRRIQREKWDVCASRTLPCKEAVHEASAPLT